MKPSNKISNKSIHIYKDNPEAIFRIFCFHHAAGSASKYLSWHQKLSKQCEIAAIQFPGRETRQNEPFYVSAHDAIAEAAAAIMSFGDLPFAIFGHSLGGSIGYAVAIELERRSGNSPSFVAVAAARPPHLPAPSNLTCDLDDVALIEKLKMYSGTPPSILSNTRAISYFLPRVRADFALSETFVLPQPVELICPLISFVAADDHLVSAKETNEWRLCATDFTQVSDFAGGHFFVDSLSDRMFCYLNDALLRVT